MEEIIFLHDFIGIILVFIITFVGYCLIYTIFNKFTIKSLLERQIVEYIWTIIPIMILVQIAIPSLLLLYMLDESIDCSLSVKVIAHQWYWRYEYTDKWFLEKLKIPQVEFDSYMIPSNELEIGIFRLLEVDNRVVLPYNLHTRLLITSADVLHAWTVPSLGVKVDAVPGRINIVRIIIQRPGLRFGQCSEICGANHRFIPICIEAVNLKTWINWILFY